LTVVLVTGMSGTGKSTALLELARRGHRVVDTDYGGWTEDVPASDGSGPDRRWREDRIAALLDGHDDGALFVSGCRPSRQTRASARPSPAARPVALPRIGSARAPSDPQLSRTILDTVEPLLRAGATAAIDARLRPEDVADELERIAGAVTSR
jgi:hypothetical protein